MELSKLEKIIEIMGEKINILADCMVEKNQQPQPQKYKYDDLLLKYFSSKMLDTKECTQYDKISLFQNFITPYFKDMYVSDIDKIKLNDWQSTIWNSKSKYQKKYSYNYLTKIRGYLFSFLEWCENVYSIPNVIKSIKIPKNIEHVKSIGFFELQEFKKFIIHVDDYMYNTLFILLFYGGFRIGEVMALTDNDFLGNAINITKTLSRKTLDGSIFKITATKNYKNRITPLPRVAIIRMTEYLAWKQKSGISNVFLFGGLKPLSETSLRRQFEQYLKISQSKKITIHGFRHSYVSLLVFLGTQTKKIAELIGDTEEQVIKTYSHLYKNDKHDAISKIDNLT